METCSLLERIDLAKKRFEKDPPIISFLDDIKKEITIQDDEIKKMVEKLLKNRIYRPDPRSSFINY